MTEEKFPPIQQRLMEFIRREFHPGFNHYNVSKLIGDASSRQYFRYVTDSRKSFILAAYPEAFDPERFSYRQIYSLLREIGIPVPRILNLDGALGIVLQEDLGNDTLQRHFLEADELERKRRLRDSIDYIGRIQAEGSRRLQPGYEAAKLAFDEEKLNWEFSFFARQYLHNYRGFEDSAYAPLLEEFDRIAAELASAPRVLCHRDYHIRNLMLKDGKIYVIDFQDARWGPASYDLVSLLKDSIELSPGEVADHKSYYLSLTETGLTPRDFDRQFHLMSIQRLIKAQGTYAYQVIVRENFIYEQYMAGSLHRTQMALDALPEFPAIRKLVDAELGR